ncbi:hypothetical protein AB0O07_12950 [Streptomyces sp. NPDC093085]|uniref:hypothetical protein n=1 Tax=Streptomyces sp. NPDC093085 TaxID=3155068 RepID=UPI00342B7202
MTHTTDPYRPTAQQTYNQQGPGQQAEGGQTEGGQAEGVARDGMVRAGLWTVVVLSVIINMASNFGSLPIWTNLVSGVVTVAAVTALIVRARRHR